MDTTDKDNGTNDLQAILNRRRKNTQGFHMKARESDADCLPSFIQERFCFLQRLDPSSTLFNRFPAVRLKGRLDAERLKRAFHAVVARHESLRTGFRDKDGQIMAFVRKAVSVPFVEHDLDHVAPEKREALAHQLCVEAVSISFDLEKDVLLRPVLVKTGDDDNILLVVAHHAILDGWSDGIFLSDLITAYGSDKALPAPRLDYLDYATAQRAHVEQIQERLVEEWRARLDSFPTTFELPTDFPRPAKPSGQGDRVRIADPDKLGSLIGTLSRQTACTPFVAMLAVIEIALSRLSGMTRFLIGSPTAGRQWQETEAMIGCFVNTLVLRADLSDDPSFLELANRVKSDLIGALQRQDLPFERLVESLSLDRNVSRDPLLQVFFALNNTPPAKTAFDEWAVERYPLHGFSAQGDLNITVMQTGDKLDAALEYSPELWRRETAEAFAAHLEALIEAAAANLEGPISELDHWSPSAFERIVQRRNRTDAPLPDRAVASPLAVIEETMSAHAASIAVEACDDVLTYAELQRRVERLANELTRAGLRHGDRTGLCLPRDSRLIVAILSIWRLGACYVPLDPALPSSRLVQIACDAEVAIVLGTSVTCQTFTGQVRTLDFPDMAPTKNAPHEPTTSRAWPTGDDIAYMIYTSGSTGKPKGVPITHAALLNLLLSFRKQLAFEPSHAFLAITTPSFDIAGLELMLPLIVGGKVILADGATVKDPALLIAAIQKHRPRFFQATPATWRALLDEGWEGDNDLVGLCGGEAIPATLSDSLCPRIKELWGVYGPTETTIWSMCVRLKKGANTTALGAPIDNTSIFVLDKNNRPAMVGSVHELVIGGQGLSPGYWRRPDLTEEKFVKVENLQGTWLYRTGDLARYSSNGDIEFRGRNDYQVKIRGFRIELGEIEAALEAEEGMETAIATTCGEDLDRILLAYVLVNDACHFDGERTRNNLAKRLPQYMVPSTIVPLESFPLNANGKVDRKKLASLGVVSHAKFQVLPETAVEKHLAQLWQDVLKREKIDINANFFSLGGHSLMAMRLLSQINNELGKKLALRELFEQPTLAAMARLIEGNGAPSRPADELFRNAKAPVSLIVRQRGEGGNLTLLTGANGFVGAHLLTSLMTLRPNEPVLAIVRDKDEPAARQRLKTSLSSYELSEALADRIEIIAGDLCESSDSAFWNLLKSRVEGRLGRVFHNAAQVNFALPYASLRDANVEATWKLAEIAAREGAAFDFISTAYVADAAEESVPRPVPENAVLNAPDRLDLGYVQSKWVAEQRLLAAQKDGLSLRIHRLGRIGGARKSGACQPMDLLWALLYAVARLKIAPEIEADIDSLPVDLAADMIASLHNDHPAINHIVVSEGIPLSKLVEILRAAGYKISMVSWNEWRDVVSQSKIPEIMRIAALLPHGPLGGARIFGASQRFGFAKTNVRLSPLGLSLPKTEAEDIVRTLARFIKTDQFPSLLPLR